MSGKRARISPEQYAAYLRQTAAKQREIAVEFDQQAERAERRILGRLPDGDRGHTWRISIEERGSSKVTGDEHHSDASEFNPLPTSVEVRAWNLSDALAQAAALPFSDWFPERED